MSKISKVYVVGISLFSVALMALAIFFALKTQNLESQLADPNFIMVTSEFNSGVGVIMPAVSTASPTIEPTYESYDVPDRISGCRVSLKGNQFVPLFDQPNGDNQVGMVKTHTTLVIGGAQRPPHDGWWIEIYLSDSSNWAVFPQKWGIVSGWISYDPWQLRSQDHCHYLDSLGFYPTSQWDNGIDE